MRYKGEFKNIDNNSLYVYITTDNDSSTSTDINLSAEPLTTTYEGSDDYLYKPVKYSSTTIKILSEDYLYDLYSSKPQENKVEILNYMGNMVWIGYTTPNLYTQGYENPIEEIEVECIDALSTLQYLNYTPINDNKSIITFVELINHLLSKCNAYSRFYISNTTYNPNYSTEYFWEKLKISEMNFFDEDDEPMKCDEVLEELCQFMNLTCYAYGNEVFFIDYDAIKNGINTYYRYSIGTTTEPTIVTLEQTHTITSSDYAENGSTLSLDNVFNKAIVKSSLYSFDDAIPNIFDENDIENYGTNQIYTENLSIEDATIGKGKHKVFMRYYTNPKYKSYYYTKDLFPYSPLDQIEYSFTQGFVGATICKGYFKEVDSFDEDINSLSFTNYLLLHSHNTNDTPVLTRKQYAGKEDAGNTDNLYITLDEEEGIPLFESIVDFDPAFIGGDDVYFVIEGSYIQMDREGKMFIPENYDNKNDTLIEENLWLKAKLEFNGQYWNGTQWTTTDTCFKLEFSSDDNDHHINVDFPIKNNITWDMGLEGEGYAIKLPSFGISTTRPILTLYSPHKNNADYRCDAVWLKNFGISLMIADKDLDSEDETDTEYSNVIDEDFVNEMDDVNFKICTWDNKAPNYSAVGQINGANLLYLDTTYNKATKQTLRQEEHFIYRLVNQYSTPSTILELTLKNDYKLYSTLTDSYLGKTFIIDSATIDWFWNKAELKLIEKK